jgi:hypothetical protein
MMLQVYISSDIVEHAAMKLITSAVREHLERTSAMGSKKPEGRAERSLREVRDESSDVIMGGILNKKLLRSCA